MRFVREQDEVALDGTRWHSMALDGPDGNDERTRTVTIRQAGVPLENATPLGSRPPQDDSIQSMEEIGRRAAVARVAADGTRWCRCCDTTAASGATSVYCPDHLKQRNPFLKRLRRQAQREAAEALRASVAASAPATPVIPEGMVLVPQEALLLIARAATQMATHVSRASLHYQDLARRDGRDPVWLDNLMLSAKNLDAVINSEILNGEVLPPVIVRARQRQPAAQRPHAAGQPMSRAVSVPGRTVPNVRNRIG